MAVNRIAAYHVQQRRALARHLTLFDRLQDIDPHRRWYERRRANRIMAAHAARAEARAYRAWVRACSVWVDAGETPEYFYRGF